MVLRKGTVQLPQRSIVSNSLLLLKHAFGQTEDSVPCHSFLIYQWTQPSKKIWKDSVPEGDNLFA